MDKFRAALRSRATEAPAEGPADASKPPAKAPETPPATTPPPAPTKPASEAVKPAVEPPAKPAEAAKPAETPKPTEPAKPADAPKEKLGPWQLKERFEKRAKAAEAEVADLRTKMSKMGDANALRERAERLEARNKDLEETIRHYDYTKSEEYQTKYEKPFVDAWGKAVSDFGELVITDADGNPRRATDKDLYALVNLPLGEARKRANELFGDAAEDAMAHYRKIRDLADEQRRAVDSVKKEGSERQKMQEETRQRIAEEIGGAWQEFISADESKHEFLKEKEGDDEWNGRLKAAKEFVDNSLFRVNAGDDKLTPEQRKEAIRNHASVRGRAIGFTMLRLENKRLRGQLDELATELSKYKSAEPPAGVGREPGAVAARPASAWEAARAELRRRANR